MVAYVILIIIGYMRHDEDQAQRIYQMEALEKKRLFTLFTIVFYVFTQGLLEWSVFHIP